MLFCRLVGPRRRNIAPGRLTAARAAFRLDRRFGSFGFCRRYGWLFCGLDGASQKGRLTAHPFMIPCNHACLFRRNVNRPAISCAARPSGSNTCAVCPKAGASSWAFSRDIVTAFEHATNSEIGADLMTFGNYRKVCNTADRSLSRVQAHQAPAAVPYRINKRPFIHSVRPRVANMTQP